MKIPIPRFSLKWLLVGVAISAVLMGLATQLGMVTGNFEITKNSLQADEYGRVSGILSYRFSRVRKQMAPEHFDFACSITSLPNRELLDLRPGDKMKLRYRLYDVGPLKKQNVYALFLTDQLGIDEAHLEHYSNRKGWTVVIINGSL